MENQFGIDTPVGDWLKSDEGIHEEVLRQRTAEKVDKHFETKEELTGTEEQALRRQTDIM